MSKGDTPRPMNREAWEQAPYWANLERLEKKRKAEAKKRRKAAK
jgi:hypothetical protein